MGKYPFKIRVKDPELNKIFKRLKRDRVSKIDKKMSKRLGWKIKPIRKDLRITRDYSYDNQSFLQAMPDLKIRKRKNRYIFDKIL